MDSEQMSWRKAISWILHCLWLLTAALGIAQAGDFLFGQTLDPPITGSLLNEFNSGFWYSEGLYAILTVVLMALAYWVEPKSATK